MQAIRSSLSWDVQYLSAHHFMHSKELSPPPQPPEQAIRSSLSLDVQYLSAHHFTHSKEFVPPPQPFMQAIRSSLSRDVQYSYSHHFTQARSCPLLSPAVPRKPERRAKRERVTTFMIVSRCCVVDLLGYYNYYSNGTTYYQKRMNE